MRNEVKHNWHLCNSGLCCRGLHSVTQNLLGCAMQISSEIQSQKDERALVVSQ